MKPPTIADVEEVKLEAAVNQVLKQLSEGGHSKYDITIERILSEADDDNLDVASVLFNWPLMSWIEAMNFRIWTMTALYTEKKVWYVSL